MDEGFILLYRKFLSWEWYQDNNVKILFIHCLIKANFKAKEWRGITIKRGQFFTSINHLSNDLNLSIKEIRTALNKLKKTNEIVQNGASNGTMITVCKYDDYQKEMKPKGKPRANEGQAKGKRGATTNNDNKENKENNDNKTIAKNEFLHEREVLNNVYNLFDFEIVKKLTETQKYNWLDTINKLNRIDGYEFLEIEKTIIWGRNDEFWKSNFHTIPTLRKKKNDISKFFQINKKMNYEAAGKNGNSDRENEFIEFRKHLAENLANDPDLK